MQRNRLMKNLGAVLLVMFSLVLVACGRDASTVENAIEGHWTVSDARVNDEPLEEVIQNMDEWLDVNEEDVTNPEQGTQQIDLDLYFDEGILTIENAEGDVNTLPYVVQDTDEENHMLTLEYHITDEEIDILLNETIRFETEDREAYSSEVSIVDVSWTDTASEEETSALEQELSQIGEELAREVLYSLNIEYNAAYVDNQEAPENTDTNTTNE